MNKYVLLIIYCVVSCFYSFALRFRGVNMTCCCIPTRLPMHIALRNIFRRIRCVSACCGGQIVIQQSELDGGTTPPRSVLQPKFWRRRCSLPYRAVKNYGKF